MRTVDGSKVILYVSFAAFVIGCSAPPTEERVGTRQEPFTFTGKGSVAEVSVGSSHPGSDLEYQSEQSMVSLDRGRNGYTLVTGYNDVTGMVNTATHEWIEPFSTMGISISTDGGDTWTPQAQLTPSIWGDNVGLAGDPWLATDSTRTKAWYVNLAKNASGYNTGFYISTSVDSGLTWSAPDFHEVGGYVDKPSIAVTPDGQDLYLAYYQTGEAPGSPDAGIYVDHIGVQWVTRTRIPYNTPGTGYQNPIVRLMTDQEAQSWVVVTFEDFQAYSTYAESNVHLAMSADNGQSFGISSDPVIGVQAAQPIGYAGLPVRNSIGVHDFVIDPKPDPVSGGLYCEIVYEDSGAIRFMRTLNGSSWSSPVLISENGRAWNPAIAANSFRVVVTYYLQPTDSEQTRVYARYSPDSGSTWSDPYELSENAFAPCLAGGGYFGDYNGLTPATPTTVRFYATWADSSAGCEAYNQPLTARHQHTVGVWFY